MPPMTPDTGDLAGRLELRRDRLHDYQPQPAAAGRLVRMVGLTLEAVGLNVAVGSRCLVTARAGRQIEAEVVGFSEHRI
jgi:flagellum-specific ATP synthase